MMQPDYEYVISLMRGNRCVGVVRTQSIDEANERSSLWNSNGEGHTSKIERKERVQQTEGAERIPSPEYLTQGYLRDMFR